MEPNAGKHLSKSFREPPLDLVAVRFVRQLWRPLLTTLALFALGGILLLALWRSVADFGFDDLVAALGSLRLTTLISGLAATLLSYAVLVGYDFLALHYVGIRLPLLTVLLTSFCSYAIGNTVGLGTFSGGVIRYRLYSATGLSPTQIARVVGFISFAFGVGAFSVTSLCIELRAQEVGYLLGASPGILQMIAGGCLALVFAFLAVWLIHSRPIRLGALEIAAPSANLVFALLALGTADILAASAVLWVLVPASPFDFLTFTALYASALILGMLTHIPGGLGVI